jgi:hypothetical protein
MGFFGSLFGKENSGNSPTTNNTENIDQKLQTGEGSVGASASGSGVVNINTSDMGAIDGALKFANASGDSAFKFGNAALDTNALITDGALGFAGQTVDGAFKFANANNDTNAKLVNATVDSAMKAIEESNRQSAAAMAAASDGAYKLVNSATDSAMRFGDSTVAQAFNLAALMTKGSAGEAATAGKRADEITKTAMQSVQEAYADTSDTLASAYETSKAGEQKVMVAVGLAVVALVALKSFGK